jgi:hypothetical protein
MEIRIFLGWGWGFDFKNNRDEDTRVLTTARTNEYPGASVAELVLPEDVFVPVPEVDVETVVVEWVVVETVVVATVVVAVPGIHCE